MSLGGGPARRPNEIAPVLITVRGWIVLLGGIGAAFLAHRTGQPVLLVLTTLSVASLVVSLIVLLRLGGGFEVNRVVPPEVFKGDMIPIRLRIRNGGSPKSLFFMVDEPRLRDTVASVAVPVDSLSPGERREFRYELPASRRGVLQFRDVSVESQAPFGLIVSRRTIAVPGTTVILPRPGRIWDWDCAGGRRHSGVGVESLDRSGATQEFFAVREYRPEDPMKHIHWKLTAKMQEPMVREFQTTSSLEVEVVMNASRGDYPGEAGVQALDAAAELAATLCAELLRRGFFVRLWSLGRTVRPSLQESGPAHLKRLLVELASLDATRDEPFAEALGGVAGYFTPRAALIFVTSHLALPELAPAVGGLRERAFHPQLMVIEPPRARAGEGPRSPEEGILAAIARAGAPGFRFPSDGAFSLIRMREHEARRVGFRGVEAVVPVGVSWGRDEEAPA